ncbi:MAG: exosortase/archaeosortase family protein [Acidobacteria bacterium]|nr:exosortase/archaeosortase family protein [Acidobacteriota bacterium]
MEQNVLLDVEFMESPVQANIEERQPAVAAAPVSVNPPASFWVPLVWIAGVMIASFYPMLERLVAQWMNDDDMGHGFFVQVVAAYIAWQRKDAIFALEMRRNYLGLVVMLYGAVQFILGTIAAELFLTRTSIIFSIAGAVLFVGGKELLKLTAFPISLLFFMVPIPSVIYTAITFPLQIFASIVAEKSLLILGIPVLRDGNVLELAEHKLSVVEACSGIRSLLSLTFLSLVYGFFFDSRGWMRGVLLVATVPIAIAANAFRVSMTGVLYEYKSEWAEGFFHTAEGWVIFMVALSMLLAFHRFAIWFFQGISNARSQASQEPVT